MNIINMDEYVQIYVPFFGLTGKMLQKTSRSLVTSLFLHIMRKATVYQLRCEPLPVVRIGMIGLGHRGIKTLQRYADIEGSEITCLADIDAGAVERANQQLALSGRHLARTFTGEEAWREVCRQADVDLVYVCTDWNSHAPIAIEAMECGKHVAVEVPLATTVDDCRRVVEVAERTRRHCFMTENCCYDWFHLATLSLAETGALGIITHCEGAYIHDWRDLFSHQAMPGRQGFYEESCHHGGNPYPTHAIGPIAQLLGFHRHDAMDCLVAMTGHAAGEDSLLGHVSSALISTKKGATVLLQFDGTTPRPYSRLQTVCGTKGFVQKYPQPVVQTEDGLRDGEHAENFMKLLLHTPAGRLWMQGHLLGVDNEMNYAMDRRLVHCLQRGLPLDIDVYDAAEWSCLAELTRESAMAHGKQVKIPDFTNFG